MTPRVLHLSTTGANGGGAGRAAAALNAAMVDHGVDSHLQTATGLKHTIAQFADRQIWRLQRSTVRTWRSPARFDSLTAREINASNADVVNLHWVTNGFLSIEEIGRIEKPITWSLYDMWAFCGTEHYGVDAPDARWRTGYTKANRPISESGIDIDRDAWQRKRDCWHPAPVVAASTWLEERARASALMHGWPITRIPHVIDTECFAPIDREQARIEAGIPADGPVILFLSSGGIHDARKGFDLIEQALEQIRGELPEARLVVVGPTEPARTHAGGIPLHWFGTAASNEQLRALYCSADVVAVPSREDNMPLTAMEAHACGRPVVAFDIGGLPDIVEHGVTGYLAPEGGTAELAEGLLAALADAESVSVWAQAARERAETLWSPEVIVRQYLDVYEQALS